LINNVLITKVNRLSLLT